MATILEDLDCQGNAACNDLTVRGRLTVNGVPAGAGVAVEDEGIAIANNPHTTLNFVGGNVTAADAGAGVATITVIPGADVQDEGVAIANNPHRTLNFVGGGVTAADAGGGVASVTVPGITFQSHGVTIGGGVHTTLNAGQGLTMTDDGGGVATVNNNGLVNVEQDGVALANDPHNTLNFVGSGVTAVDAPGSIATITVPIGACLVFGADDINAAADTRFLSQGNIAAAGTTDAHQIPIPFAPGASAMTLRCLFVRHNTTNGNGASVVYTVFKNGIATTLTVTLATGAIGQADDMTHSTTVVAGDTVSIQAVKGAAIGSGVLNVVATLAVM